MHCSSTLTARRSARSWGLKPTQQRHLRGTRPERARLWKRMRRLRTRQWKQTSRRRIPTQYRHSNLGRRTSGWPNGDRKPTAGTPQSGTSCPLLAPGRIRQPAKSKGHAGAAGWPALGTGPGTRRRNVARAANTGGPPCPTTPGRTEQMNLPTRSSTSPT